MDTEMISKIDLPIKKKNPNEIAQFLFKKKDTLKGSYYLPKYWFLFKIIVDLLPEKVLFKIIKTLNF